MSITYSALLAGLTREHGKIAGYNVHLQKLPYIIVRSVRAQMGIPEDSIHYGQHNENQEYEKGRLSIGLGEVTFYVYVEFPTSGATYGCYIAISAISDNSYYQVSIAGETCRIQFSPDLHEGDLSNMVAIFSVALKNHVEGLLVRK